MIRDIIVTAVAMALIAFGGWFLIRLIKTRQAAEDHKYDGNNGGEVPGTGGDG